MSIKMRAVPIKTQIYQSVEDIREMENAAHDHASAIANTHIVTHRDFTFSFIDSLVFFSRLYIPRRHPQLVLSL